MSPVRSDNDPNVGGSRMEVVRGFLAHSNRTPSSTDRRRPRLWVPETLQMLCDLLIFVEEAADAVVSADLTDLGRCSVGGGRKGAACLRLRCRR